MARRILTTSVIVLGTLLMAGCPEPSGGGKDVQVVLRNQLPSSATLTNIRIVQVDLLTQSSTTKWSRSQMTVGAGQTITLGKFSVPETATLLYEIEDISWSTTWGQGRSSMNGPLFYGWMEAPGTRYITLAAP